MTVLAVFLVVMSVASAYVIPSASHKGGDVILEQAQQEEKRRTVQYARRYSCSES